MPPNTVAITASTPPHRITSAAKKSCWLITLGGLLFAAIICGGKWNGHYKVLGTKLMLFTTASAWKKQLATTLMLATSAASLPMIAKNCLLRRSHDLREECLGIAECAPKVVWGGYVKFVFIGGETQTISSVKPGTGIWDKCYFTGFMSDDLDKFKPLLIALFSLVCTNHLGLWL